MVAKDQEKQEVKKGKVLDIREGEDETLSSEEPTLNGSQPSETKEESENSELVALQEKLQAAESKYVYLYAEFENFKKRIAKEKDDLRKFGWEGPAREMISVLDNMERAVQFASPKDHKSLVDGIRMVMQLMKSSLENSGIKEISQREVFDPNVHEAVDQVASDKPEGHIIETQLKGYQMHGRLLRPSRVVISKGKEA